MHRIERIGKIVCSRRMAALAGAAWIAVVLGCMSISIGGKHITPGLHEDGAFVQEGKVHVPPGCQQAVYYPLPYAAPPNLDIDCTLHQCNIVEQKADHFVICNHGVFPRSVDWTARGVKCGPPPGLPLPPPEPVPALPPPQPLPVEPD